MKILKQIQTESFLKILMLIQIILIGYFSFLEWGLLAIITTIALLLTYNAYKYEKQRKNIP